MSGLTLLKLFPTRVETKPCARRFQPLAHSAFRTLGLSASVSQAEVFDAASSVRLALKLGVNKTFDTDLPWLEPVSRAEADVRDASGRLSDPTRRAFERLFWFHGRVTSPPVTSAAELLRAVEGLLFRDSPAACHDAALLALAGLLRLDPALRETEAWAHALRLWRQTIEREEFWSLLVAADLKGEFEQLVTFGEVGELRARAPRLVSAPVAERAKDAIVREDLRMCSRALVVLRGAGLPGALLSEYEHDILGPLEDRIESSCGSAFVWVKLYSDGAQSSGRRRNVYNEAWRKFKNQLCPMLSDFLKLAGAHSHAARRVFEHAAENLYELSNAYDQNGQRAQSLFVCLKARALAPNGSVTLPLIEDKLREHGAELKDRTEEDFVALLAHELRERREPAGLFKDSALASDRTLAGAYGRRSTSSSSFSIALLLWLMIVASFFATNKCAGPPTSGPYPSLPYPPGALNFNGRDNWYNYNYNVNLQFPPLPLIKFPPYLVEPPNTSGRKRARRPRQAQPRVSPGGTLPPPSNLNAPRPE
jgi:hypothetical protein